MLDSDASLDTRLFTFAIPDLEVALFVGGYLKRQRVVAVPGTERSLKYCAETHLLYC